MALKISGCGSALPDKILTNKELESMVDTTDEWIRERTGICERHIAAEGETVVSLAAEACLKALEDARKDPKDVEMILLATCSEQMRLPCGAAQIQSKIGAENAVAFDINAACSGFLFALQTADAYIATGAYGNALIVGSEVLSKIVDWKDRGSCVLFGDGAGAVFVEKREENCGVLGMIQGSDGSRGNVLYCRSAMYGATADNAFEKEDHFIHMNGGEVYKFAVRQVPDCIEKALDKAGISLGDVDMFVLHQANARIIEAVAKRLNVSMERFPVNLDRVGNTSSAAIPLLLDELKKNDKIKNGQIIVLSGFGAGLTYGACVLRW